MAEEKPKKILIVEDAPEVLMILENFLRVHGFEVQTALDAYQGLDRIESDMPDLILLDVRMPGMDGYQFCEKIKTDEKYKHVPIIIVSVKCSPEDVKKGIDKGASAYIPKPFDPDEVIAKVKELLSQ
ncbi:PleD family two-component system response regulator [Candidatus Margulisiibacteriota bacterium]